MGKQTVSTRALATRKWLDYFFFFLWTNCNLFRCICGETKSNPAKIRHFGTCATLGLHTVNIIKAAKELS